MFRLDSNVLIDIATQDPAWVACALAGPLVTNPILYVEVAVGFLTEELVNEFFSKLNISRLPLPYDSAFPASRAFAAYQKRGGTRTSLLPDFFIGAHALVEDLTVVTRDEARFRTYFPQVNIIAP